MSDGFIVPDHFDGMGTFQLDRHRVALVRNHELRRETRSPGPSGGRAALDQRLAALPHFGTDNDGLVLPGGTSPLI